jgi:iron complex outermembrane receptor protein
VALSGVKIRVVNEASGTVAQTATDAEGRYTVTGLVSGLYSVLAAMVGMEPVVRRDIRITGDGAVSLDLFMNLAPLLLGEITVTAMLREQTLDDVPFSITAPGARVMRARGVDNIEDLSANVAGFSIQNLGPGQSQIAVRGASSGQIARDQPGVKEQVGSYLDDVPVSMSLFTPDLDLFDVSRVEVLRGPQGTLFGSGSLSGTVRYITNQPQFGTRGVFGEVGGSWIDGGSPGGVTKLGFNHPLGDRAAVRVAGYYNRLGGYMDAVQPNLSIDENVNTGTRAGVRAALRVEPSDRLSITPRIVYQRVEADGWNRIDAYNILANPWTTTRPAVTLGERQLFTQIGEPYTDDFVLGDLKVGYGFGAVSLTSITAFTHRDILVVRDGTALASSITGGSLGLPEEVYTLDAPLNDSTTAKAFTQELRLAGGTPTVQWVLGGFFASSQRDYGQNVLVAGFEDKSGIPTQGLRAGKDVLFFSDLDYNLQQVSLFGEATVVINDRLSVTGGLRWFHFDEDRVQVFDGVFGNDNNGTSLVHNIDTTTANGFAPRFIVSYKASDMVTLNAQASRGFRLGGINDPLNVPLCTEEDLATYSGQDTWKNETAWNFEVGAKARLADGRASLNVSAFQIDIDDLQVVVTAGSCSSRLVLGAPKARSQGVEVEFTAAPTDRLELAFSGSLNNSRLKSTLVSVDGSPISIPGIAPGNRLPSVPRFQGNVAATYRWPVGRASTAYLSGAYSYVGARFTQMDDHATTLGTVTLPAFGSTTPGAPYAPGSPGTFLFDPELPAYNLVNLRVGLIRGNWDVALFGNNLTDERAFLALDRERGTLARVGYLTNQPQTVGVTASFAY